MESLCSLCPKWDGLHPGGPRPAAPPERTKFASAMAGTRLIVHGGGRGRSFLNDVWEYHVGRRWRCVVADGDEDGPCQRRAHTAVVFDGQFFIFGGRNRSGRMADMHSLSVGSCGETCCGPPAEWRWRPVATSDGPCARAAHTSCVVRQNMYVFGGDGEGGKPLNDLWLCDLSQAAQLQPRKIWARVDARGSPPSARLGHAAAVAGGCMYVFGGYNGSALCDLHRLDLDSRQPQWAEIELTHPPRPCTFPGLVAAPAPDGWSLFLWGGAFVEAQAMSGTLYRHDCGRGEGFTAVPVCGRLPSSRLGHALVYEPQRGRVLLFGGSDVNSGYFNDVLAVDPRTPSLKQLLRRVILQLGVPYRPHGHVDPAAAPPADS
eukprot:TRINITY_DN21277_c0_g1_i1.p1 TRINITY_DN21277_c0_g1~~TRINITY_DN21277_c0_g1_i1.p1  ORF type:complete len:375 (+),score=71.67 TRINITY_DN21277_c0_g1_i1:96-1220(+)